MLRREADKPLSLGKIGESLPALFVDVRPYGGNDIDRAADGLLEPGIRDSTRASFEKKIEDNTKEIEKLTAKMKLADEAIQSYEAIIGKDGKITVTEETLFKNPILSRQLIRLLVDKITVGNENITVKILENNQGESE